MMCRHALWLPFLLVGCIKAPEILVVDRATALEEQAGGSFRELEQGLSERAVSPGPVPLTPNDLEALGIRPTPLVDQAEQTAADRLDALLRQRCIGEGRDGLLVDTHDECVGASDRAQAVALIDRTNRARMQLWRWMQAQHPESSPQAVRAAWREVHTRGVVCGAWVQRDDGTWEPKSC